MISVGLWDPVCDTDLSVFAGRGERGALHEENLLQATAAVLHSPGHWHALLQRPVSAHPRGSVDGAVTHLAAAPSQSLAAGLSCDDAGLLLWIINKSNEPNIINTYNNTI